jgi:thiamine biosynthesis lipoprotein
MRQIHFRAMGCEMLAVLDTVGPAGEAALAAVPGWFAAWEATLSRFRDDSELSRLNRRAGAGWTNVSRALYAVVAAGVAAARRTGGLVTPTLLCELEQAGYDRDFTLVGADAPPAGLDAPRRRGAGAAQPDSWRRVRLDPRQRAVALPRGVRLDLGGIGKGWAAEVAAGRLAAHGPALVDAGGDIAVSGTRADGTPWPVAVADPRAPGTELDLLLLSSGGVATSGRDHRRWRQGGSERHHIIDPRTGAPALTDLLAVTVVAPSTRAAEAAAKAVLILGRTAGNRWLMARPELAGLLVTEAGDVIRTPTLESYRWREPATEGARR